MKIIPKEVNVNINVYWVVSLFVSLVISFIIVFLLQANYKNNLEYGFIQPKTEGYSNNFDKYYQYLGIWLKKQESRGLKNLKDFEFFSYVSRKSEYENRYFNVPKSNHLGWCEIQGYTKDFQTFFGNVVSTDFYKMNLTEDLNGYSLDDIKKLKKAVSGPLIYSDQYFEVIFQDEELPPAWKITEKYKKFVFRNPYCECNSESHKYYIWLLATIEDWLAVFVIGIIITMVFYLYKKINLNIKIIK